MTNIGKAAGSLVAFEQSRHVHVQKRARFVVLKEKYGIAHVLTDAGNAGQRNLLRGKNPVVFGSVDRQPLDRARPALPEPNGLEVGFELVNWSLCKVVPTLKPAKKIVVNTPYSLGPGPLK